MLIFCIHGFVVNIWWKYKQEQWTFCLCLSNASLCFSLRPITITIQLQLHSKACHIIAAGSKLCNSRCIPLCSILPPWDTRETILLWLAEEGEKCKEKFSTVFCWFSPGGQTSARSRSLRWFSLDSTHREMAINAYSWWKLEFISEHDWWTTDSGMDMLIHARLDALCGLSHTQGPHDSASGPDG